MACAPTAPATALATAMMIFRMNSPIDFLHFSGFNSTIVLHLCTPCLTGQSVLGSVIRQGYRMTGRASIMRSGYWHGRRASVIRSGWSQRYPVRMTGQTAKEALSVRIIGIFAGTTGATCTACSACARINRFIGSFGILRSRPPLILHPAKQGSGSASGARTAGRCGCKLHPEGRQSAKPKHHRLYSRRDRWHWLGW